MVALHDASPNDLQTWRDNYGSDVVLLLDNTSSVYNMFKEDNSRPQYIVMDQTMHIIFKGRGSSGKQQAEDAVLNALNAE